MKTAPRSLKDIRRMRRIALILWPYARKYKRLLLTGVVLTGLHIAFNLAQPWPLKWIIDSLSGSPGASAILPRLGGLDARIAVFSGLYILFSILAGTAAYGQNLLLASIGNRILAVFRLDLFSHVLRQSLAFHERKEIGELLTRVVYDTSRLRQGLRNILIRTVQTALMLMSKVFVLLWIDVRLAAILALFGIVALLLMRKPSRRIFRAARKQRRREGGLASIVGENLIGIREYQMFRPGAIADERFERMNSISLKGEQKVRRLAAALLFRTEILMAACICLILWIGGQAVQSGRLSPGDLVLFFYYAADLINPFRSFARQAALTGRTLACGDRLAKMMDKSPVVKDLPEAVSVTDPRGEIVFENVSFRNPHLWRGGRKNILRDVSFRLEPGERLAVLGPNGAGKSTLIRLLLRFADPDAGRITLDGKDLRDCTLASVRDQTSVVFQESVFFGLTVHENIALGRVGASHEEVQKVAERTQLAGMIEKMPLGYDSPVHRQGGLFSGGEKQKIAIARAVLRDGRIWLLDEPVSALDVEASDALTKLLLDVSKGRTTVWVTHDFRILRHMDRVLFLDRGRVRFFGTGEEFKAWVDQDNGVRYDETPMNRRSLD